MDTIGSKLKKLLSQQNIRRNKLAEDIDIYPSRLSNYLRDKREPDIETPAKMAEYLNVDLKFFANIRFKNTEITESPPQYHKNESELFDVFKIPYINTYTHMTPIEDKFIFINKMFLTFIENPEKMLSRMYWKVLLKGCSLIKGIVF